MKCNQEYRGKKKDKTHAWDFLALKSFCMHTDESTDEYLIINFSKAAVNMSVAFYSSNTKVYISAKSEKDAGSHL